MREVEDHFIKLGKEEDIKENRNNTSKGAGGKVSIVGEEISDTEIKVEVACLKNRKAMAEDKIPNEFIKKGGEGLR